MSKTFYRVKVTVEIAIGTFANSQEEAEFNAETAARLYLGQSKTTSFARFKASLVPAPEGKRFQEDAPAPVQLPASCSPLPFIEFGSLKFGGHSS